MGFDLDAYLNKGVEALLKDIVRATIHNPKAILFMAKYVLASRKASQIRARAAKQGLHTPPFLIASISSKCNLHCAGCYARANGACFDSESEHQLSDSDWKRIFEEARDLGIGFILLAGGEPLMRMGVIKEAAKIREILFPLFTNGTMINTGFIDLLESSRNLIPIFSIEGDQTKTDMLRGCGVHKSVMRAMENLARRYLIFGASITVRKHNLNEITSEAFIGDLVGKGCKAVFYVEYVPFETASESHAPDGCDRELLSLRLDELRNRYKETIFISFPGDKVKSGGCLAAGRGFFHINSAGSAEPCPFSPYSDTSLKHVALKDTINSPLFRKLRETDILTAAHAGGCVLFDNVDTVKHIADRTSD